MANDSGTSADTGYVARDKELKKVGTRPPRPDGVDKVTGRAKFGADLYVPGMLIGKVLRSPHPHALIKSIDTSKAEALPGVKAVLTRDDFEDRSSEFVPAGEMMVNYRDIVRNVMAREKALYEGHAVAAVAATSNAIARQALKLIEVDYEPLPHVIDAVEGDETGCAAAARRHDHRGSRTGADQALQRGQAYRVRHRRHRGRLRGRRRGDRTQVRYPAGAPSLYRTPCLRRQRLRGRPGRTLDHHAGPLRGACPLRALAGDGHLQDPA